MSDAVALPLAGSISPKVEMDEAFGVQALWYRFMDNRLRPRKVIDGGSASSILQVVESGLVLSREWFRT